MMKRLGIILTIIIVIFLVFSVLKNEYARFLPSPGVGMQTAINRGSIEHLFIGSSTFRRGLDIRELDCLGDVYILGYNGNQPSFMVMELEYLLKNDIKIGNIYIDFYPYTAAMKRKLSDTKLLSETDFRFKVELWKYLRSGDESGGERPEFSKRIRQFWEIFFRSNNETIAWWPIYALYTGKENVNGGSLQKVSGTSFEKLAARPLYGLRDGIQAEQVEAYRKLIRLAHERKIGLYFIETPKYIRLREDPDYIYLRDEILKSLGDEISDGEMVGMIYPEEFERTPSNFVDFVHLSGAGSVSYTQELCNYFQEKTAAMIRDEEPRSTLEK